MLWRVIAATQALLPAKYHGNAHNGGGTSRGSAWATDALDGCMVESVGLVASVNGCRASRIATRGYDPGFRVSRLNGNGASEGSERAGDTALSPIGKSVRTILSETWPAVFLNRSTSAQTGTRPARLDSFECAIKPLFPAQPTQPNTQDATLSKDRIRPPSSAFGHA